MSADAIRISIVSHGLRAGGGVSVGKNFIASVTSAMPGVKFQVFVPEGLSYENCVDSAVEVEWHAYRPSVGKLGRWFYDRYILRRKIAEFRPSLILCLGNVGIRFPSAPQVILIQDAHYFYPSKHYVREPWWQKLAFYYMRYHFSQDLKSTQVLLCQTETAMKRIRDWYAFNGQIVLFPNAVSKASSAGNAINSEIREKIRRDRFCIFYLTRYYTHKNIEILVDLFIKYRHEMADTVLYITISEDQHVNVKKIINTIKDYGLEQNIVNIGPVRQEELAGIYSEMDALVMPSTLESFSGTYLEAMQFGCPVVASNLDFAIEVCGDAALYFDPWDVDDLFKVLTRLKSEPELASALRLRGNNIVCNRVNSWEDNAKIIQSITAAVIA